MTTKAHPQVQKNLHPERDFKIQDLPRDTEEQKSKYASLMERAKLVGLDVTHTENDVLKLEK